MRRVEIKAEKLAVRRRAQKALLPIAVACAMAGGATTGPAAFAETSHEYESASITVVQPSASADEGFTYDAYKVFDADIHSNGSASRISWASANAKVAVLAFLDSLAGSESYSAWLSSEGHVTANDHDNAQNAAEFIADRIAADESDEVFGGTPAPKVAGSFADRLSRAVQGAQPEIAHSTSSDAGVISGGTEGYYLIVTTPSSIGAGEAGTAPMWVPMGGSLSSIQSKEAAPHLSFTVREDKTGLAGAAADSNARQDLEYAVTAVYPTNINTYSSYSDVFTIELPAGMSTENGASGANAGDFTVVLSGTALVGGERIGVSKDITDDPGTSIAVADRRVIISVADAQSAASGLRAQHEGFQIGSVAVTYSAHLDADAVMGSAGQATTVVHAYTKDPVSLGTVDSEELSVKVFAYQAQISIIDKSNQQPIEGVGFHIVADTDFGKAGVTYYVQADGSLSIVAHEFFTGADGTLTVAGLDEGTYVIHESTVPDGYMAPDSDTVLTIASSLDQAAQFVSFSASVTGGEAAMIAGDAATELAGQDAAAGKAFVQIVNEKCFVMPVTGLRGNDVLYAMAGLLGISGAAALAVGSRRDREKHDRK